MEMMLYPAELPDLGLHAPFLKSHQVRVKRVVRENNCDGTFSSRVR